MSVNADPTSLFIICKLDIEFRYCVKKHLS